MKKCLFLMLMFISISMGVVAQKPYKVFCELLGTGKLFSNKVTVTVDFGQETSFWFGSSNQYLVDDNGKAIKFNSMVDAMNYMGKRGWVFEQAYVVTTNQQNVYHWLLSKEVTQDFDDNQESIKLEESDKKKDSHKKRRKITDDVYN